MYANWQGNFIDVSNHFIFPEKANQICINEVNRRKIGYLDNKDTQWSRVYNIYNTTVTLTTSGNYTGLYLFGCIAPDKTHICHNGQRFNSGDKFYTLTTKDRHGILNNGHIRRLHPIECERLQTLPDQFTQGVSDTQRYIALGNGRTVDIIAHLLSHI